MKKLVALVLIVMFMGFEVQAATLAGAITKYKNSNYTGCINDLDSVLTSMSKKKDKDMAQKVMGTINKFDSQKLINGDVNENKKFNEEMKKIAKYDSVDSTKWAYIFYYYALSLHQIGMGQNALRYYAVAKVFSPQSKIGQYADVAKQCLDAPGSCASSDIDEFIKSGKQVDDAIIKKELQQKIEKQKEEINRGQGLSYDNESLDNKIAWVDAGVPDINEIGKADTSSMSNDMPTDEEIGRAVRTLQKAGINPVSYMNAPVNNEYAQLNALLNDGNNNGYSNDYATMMMMNNQTGKISPEVMQTLMRQQMMGGFGF